VPAIIGKDGFLLIRDFSLIREPVLRQCVSKAVVQTSAKSGPDCCVNVRGDVFRMDADSREALDWVCALLGYAGQIE
jgi:hypothetical protein